MKQQLKKILPLLKLYRFCFRKKNEIVNWYTIPSYEKKRKIILELSKKYACTNVFVETGTYMGDTIAYLKQSFSKLISIELSHELAEKAKQRFQGDDSISIIQGDSATQLKNILQGINYPVTFWLDGHYSSEFWSGSDYITTAKGDKNTPVLEELKQIANHSVKRHLILIDDARLFRGKNDYPDISELFDFVRGYFPHYTFKVKNDIIRILPAK